MTVKWLLGILLFVFSLVLMPESNACTAFCLKKGNKIYLAKNLDWGIGAGYLFLNERGVNKSILNTGQLNKNEFGWRSKYKSITFNQFGKEFPLSGMNEHGLVVEELNMVPVMLKPDSTKQQINEFQLVQYLLDNCKSTDEAIEQLNKFQLKPLLQPLHYLIADKQGNVVIVEFNSSDFNIYSAKKTGLPVLSNNNYKQSLKYLKNFQGFGGDLPIKYSLASNDRFVSVANLLEQYNGQEPISYVFLILDTVRQYDTKWSMVYDINNLTVSFQFHSCDTIKLFDFKSLVELESVSGLGADLTDCNAVSVKDMSYITKDDNTRLLQEVFSQIGRLTEREADSGLLGKMIMMGNQHLEQENWLINR